MSTLKRFIAMALVTLIIAPPWALAGFKADSAEIHVALSTSELQAVRGGVYGGRIGIHNGGILELACGDYDVWNTAQYGPAWEVINSYYQSSYQTSCPNGGTQFIPHYPSSLFVQFAAGALITRDDYIGAAPPILEIYSNNLKVQDIPCVPYQPFKTATAHGLFNVDLNAWACPGNGTFLNEFWVQNIIQNVHHGLNVLRAVTNINQPGDDHTGRDQEVRFYYVQ